MTPLAKPVTARGLLTSGMPSWLQPTLQNPTHLPEISTPITPLDHTPSLPAKITIVSTHLLDILTPLTPLDPKSFIPTQISEMSPSLLTIPLEIRLHIYAYVLASHPIEHPHLSPSLTGQHQSPQSTSTTSNIHANEPQYQTRLPTALLISCSRIYTESSALPFQISSFAFTNWFSSGVYAARQFSRGLKAWQRSSIRNVSLDVLGRDLWTGDAGMSRLGGNMGAVVNVYRGEGGRKDDSVLGEWWDLCRLWSGVRSLRLRVRGSVMRPAAKEAGMVLYREFRVEDTLFNVGLPWIQEGLLQLMELRKLEIEVEDELIDTEAKEAFCIKLREAFEQHRERDSEVEVQFVERAKEKVIVEEIKVVEEEEEREGWVDL